MAAEGEFAFVIAVFAVDNELISKDLYASVVLAVLISTIIPPFCLRYIISRYNQKSQDKVQEAIQIEYNRQETLEHLTEEEREQQLKEGIVGNTALFVCIQIQCRSKWGILTTILNTCQKLGLEIIDNRSWHPRGVDTTMVNEIYASNTTGGEGPIEDRIAHIQDQFYEAIGQDEGDSKVKVTRWLPGVLKEITEEVVEEVEKPTEEGRAPARTLRKSVSSRLAFEATKALESKRNLQLAATQEKTVEEILAESGAGPAPETADTAEPAEGTKKRKRVRQKMRSTPVTGGSLFGDDLDSLAPLPKPDADLTATGRRKSFLESMGQQGKPAELVVGREVFKIRISPETLSRIRKGYSGSYVGDEGIHISTEDLPVETRLQGFVRNPNQNLMRITEEPPEDGASEFSDTGGFSDEFSKDDPPGKMM